YATHAEFGCHSLVPGTTLEALERGFGEAQRFGGDFCLATHYWELDGALAGALRGFVDFAARQPDVRFVPAEQLFHCLSLRVTDMDIEAQRQLQLLEAVQEDSRVTQRGLATKLGIALGLTNIYLKRLVRKGYIKCVNVQSNRLTYLITPRGIAEKARLTYEF